MLTGLQSRGHAVRCALRLVLRQLDGRLLAVGLEGGAGLVGGALAAVDSRSSLLVGQSSPRRLRCTGGDVQIVGHVCG